MLRRRIKSDNTPENVPMYPLTAEPHGRNQLLADALKRVGLAEKTGRGIDRIFEGSLIYGRSLPDYSNTTSTVVSLFIPRSKPGYSDGKDDFGGAESNWPPTAD